MRLGHSVIANARWLTESVRHCVHSVLHANGPANSGGLIPNRSRLLFINPMAIVVHTYRTALKGAEFDWPLIGLSALTASIYLVFGVWFFRKREARLADIL